MTSTALRKSTLRPLPSVRRPSSRICSKMLNTSGCAFSISSKSTTEYGCRRTCFGELAAFFVAHVAWRRADHARDRMLLHVFGHVQADHGALVVEQKLRQRARQFRFSDAGGPEKNERADRPVGIGKPRAIAADGVRDALERVVLPDHALAQALFHGDEFLGFAFEQAPDGNARPLADQRGDVFFVDFFLQHAAVLSALRRGASAPRPVRARPAASLP